MFSEPFEEIRTKGLLYVDKTDLVYRMATTMRYAFLSRPRRFGKSLLVSTLKSYFEGRKDLFEGLAMEGLEKDWSKHPVILISMASIKEGSVDRVEKALDRKLDEYEETYGRNVKDVYLGDRLDRLVKNAYRQAGKGVVLLIDEYDTPLLETMHDAEMLPQVCRIIRDFYGSLKDLKPYLRFVFLTGITKFSQLNVFSGLNVIMDISGMEEYASVCGFTEKEMLVHLKPGIESLAARRGWTYGEAVGKLKSTYDGYHFAWPSPDIYNPYSLLRALHEGRANHYWFGTGSSSSLVGMLRNRKLDLGKIGSQHVGPSAFYAPIEDARSAIPLLYQSGYLTIKDQDGTSGKYLLDFPNEEVREGLTQGLLAGYVGRDVTESDVDEAKEIAGLIRAGKMADAIARSGEYLERVGFTNEKYGEDHYQAMLYLLFRMGDLDVRAEVRTSAGVIDMLVLASDAIYVIELKLDRSAMAAIRQIDQKGYARTIANANPGRRVFRVGINFSSKTRTVLSGKVLPYARKD